MKRLTALLILCMLLGLDAYAGPPTIINSGSAGILTDSNCDQAKYYGLNVFCRDTGTKKLYMGTGEGITEVTGGEFDISALTEDESPTSDDLIPTVDDPAVTPANRKVTLGNAITKGHGLSDGMLKIQSGAMTPAAAGTDYFGLPPTHVPNCVFGYDGDDAFGCYDEWTLERIQTGADPALNAASNVGIDETADQLIYYSGGRAHALTNIQTKEYNASSVSAASSKLWWRVPYSITILRADCIAQGTNPAVTVDFQGCTTGTGSSCATKGITPVISDANVDVVSPAVTITESSNDILNLAYNGGASTSVTITPGTYTTGAALAANIQSAARSALTAPDLTCTWSTADAKITITAPEGYTISYAYSGSTAAAACGFPTGSDLSPAQSITGSSAVLAPQTFTTQWMAVDLSSVSGTIDHLSCTLQYVPARQ